MRSRRGTAIRRAPGRRRRRGADGGDDGPPRSGRQRRVRRGSDRARPQGPGVTVGVCDLAALAAATELARALCPDVLLEECVAGEDLRVVVIGHEVVAAAVRRPAAVVGTGRHTVGDLNAAQSRRRAAATHGESRIPVDDTTLAVVHAAGFDLDTVLPEGEHLAVRRTANLHTGGTIHNVTDRLHPALAEGAVQASCALAIPVTGLDLIVPAVDRPDYVLIEANERPGLANHEPQPPAARFVDLLVPERHGEPHGWAPPARAACPSSGAPRLRPMAKLLPIDMDYMQ